jgi:two-component system cell cycle sensor histidine kinase/response regulator CckA
MQNPIQQFSTPIQVPVPSTPAPGKVVPMPSQRKGRVLVMDDEVPILELTARLLGSRGYEVETATDGDQAVEQYRVAMESGCRFDAVILDLTVPEKMGGYDAFKAMRVIDPGVRAVVSSGYSHEPVVLNYKDYGLAGVAPKPYRTSELLGAVEQALQSAV